jgi:ankyrin repeat protein
MQMVMELRRFISHRFFGFNKIIQLLIQNKARINDRDYIGRSALYYATRNGNDDCVRILLNYGE